MGFCTPKKSERIATPAFIFGWSSQLALHTGWVELFLLRSVGFSRGFSCPQLSGIKPKYHQVFISHYINPHCTSIKPPLYAHQKREFVSRSPWTPTLHLSVEWKTQNEGLFFTHNCGRSGPETIWNMAQLTCHLVGIFHLPPPRQHKHGDVVNQHSESFESWNVRWEQRYW